MGNWDQPLTQGDLSKWQLLVIGWQDRQVITIPKFYYHDIYYGRSEFL